MTKDREFEHIKETAFWAGRLIGYDQDWEVAKEIVEAIEHSEKSLQQENERFRKLNQEQFETMDEYDNKLNDRNRRIKELEKENDSYKLASDTTVKVGDLLTKQKARIKELEEGMKAALKIKDLWAAPVTDCPPENRGEMEALQAMESLFQSLIKPQDNG